MLSSIQSEDHAAPPALRTSTTRLRRRRRLPSHGQLARQLLLQILIVLHPRRLRVVVFRLPGGDADVFDPVGVLEHLVDFFEGFACTHIVSLQEGLEGRGGVGVSARGLTHLPSPGT